MVLCNHIFLAKESTLRQQNRKRMESIFLSKTPFFQLHISLKPDLVTGTFVSFSPSVIAV